MRLTAALRVAAVVAVLGAASAVLIARQDRSIPAAKTLRTPKAPSQWWFEQRAYPFGNIPTDLWRSEVARVMAEREEAKLSTSAGNPTWQFVGPDNIGGRVSAMAVVPGGATIYMGSANGGVFKSTNTGGSWTPIFDEFNAYSIGALALNPLDNNMLYVGTGESAPAIDTYDGNGVYRTRDGGASWEHLGLPQVKRIFRIAIHPANVNNIFVAGGGSLFSVDTDGGLWRSPDGGTTWNHVLYVNSTTSASDVVINPAHPESMFCATWDFGLNPTGSAIWASVDSGLTWTQLGPANGLPAPSDSTDRIALAYAPSRPSWIYAQVIGGAPLEYKGRGMYRSTNGGATWTKRDVGTAFQESFGGFGWYFGDMAVDPVDPNRVFALGVTLIRSLDGGANWGSLGSSSIHVDHHAIWINPANNTRIYSGNDGGWYRSSTSGTSWIKGLGQPISQFYAIEVDPADVTRVMGGTQDNSTITGLSPGGWSTILGGDGFYCIVDPTDPAVVLAEFQNCCNRTGPRRSTNGGTSWNVPIGFSVSDRYNWNTPFVMDPSDHNVVLCGAQRVYKSTNNGVSYTPVSGDLASNPSSSRPLGTIATVDISPLDGQCYYTGSSNGKVWRSTDGGGAWTDITGTLPDRYVTRVVADRHDANTVYVTLSGYQRGDNAAHIYKSTDRGDTWTPIEGNLGNHPVNDLIVDQYSPDRLYAGTDLGVFATQNGGATWYPLGRGLPFQAVFDLDLHLGTNTLFAGTHGRSIWKLPLAELPVAVGAAGRPVRLDLAAPVPNPGRGTQRFALDVHQAGSVELAVFDLHGRRVRELHRGTLAAGSHAFQWDGRDASGRQTEPGVYFARAQGAGVAQTQRIVRAR